MPAQTTSDIAAAIWYPTMAEPRERCLAWGARTLEALYDLAGHRDTGVFVCDVHEYLSRPMEPEWMGGARGFRPLRSDELPPDRPFGFAIEVPRVEPPIYLHHLLDRFKESGGVVAVEEIDDLAALADSSGVVVNCTGLASRRLLGDEAAYPVRGQVVLVTNPGIHRGIIDEVEGEQITYILPRTHEVVLGGTRQVGSWDTEPDPAVTQRILASCARLEPRLVEAEVIRVRVGLRPGRDAVRLEAERAGNGVLVHNYGHDGSGYSLSWGCAQEVLSLVSAALDRP